MRMSSRFKIIREIISFVEISITRYSPQEEIIPILRKVKKEVTMQAQIIVIWVCLSAVASADPAPPNPETNTIPGRYIVKLKPGQSVDAIIGGLSPVSRVYYRYETIFPGFAAELLDSMVDTLRASDAVEYVEEDGLIHADSVASWGLDRVDQTNLPLDGVFNPLSGQGEGVNVYVFDTGINYNHEEFENRASFGFDYSETNGDDCDGHGTHTSGTIAGLQYGVAKQANIIVVRVLNCNGNGYWSDFVAGCQWAANHTTGPAIASMSMGGSGNTAADDGVQYLVDHDITVIVSAGNDDYDACNKSPARVPSVITVGSTDSDDGRSYYSNYGSCVDIFAPGRYITSAWIGGTDATNTISGTSMACPHVSGAAAILMGRSGNSMTPAEMKNALIAAATSDVVTDPQGSPNKLLFIGAGTFVECDSMSMTLYLDSSLLHDGTRPSDVHFDDPNCVGFQHDPQNIAVYTRYDRCQTKSEETEDNIIFSNTVTYYEPNAMNGTGITRENILKIPVQCELDRRRLLSDSFTPKTGLIFINETGYGYFSLRLDRYPDQTFDYPVVDETEVVNGERLYFGVNLTSVAGLAVFIETCWATPSPNSEDIKSYLFLDEGCPLDPTMEMLYYPDPSFSPFYIDAFAFIDENPQVFVHCNVLVCDGADQSSRCSQGCQSRVRRSERQARGSSSNPHLISIGPLSAKKPGFFKTKTESTGKDDTKGLASGLLTGSLVGIAFIAVSIVALFFFMKPASRYSDYRYLDEAENDR